MEKTALVQDILTGKNVREVIEQHCVKEGVTNPFTKDDIDAIQSLIDKFVAGGYSHYTKYYNVEVEKAVIEDPRYNCGGVKVALWAKGDKYPPEDEFTDVTFKRCVPYSIVDLGDEIADYINVKSGHKYIWYDTNFDLNYYYVYFRIINGQTKVNL